MGKFTNKMIKDIMSKPVNQKPRKARSPFANTVFTGCGPHKSKKDYNRQAEKLAIKKSSWDKE